MNSYEIIRAVVWIVGIPIICFLLWSILRRVRAIRELDKKLLAEEALQATNPYAEMARMYETQELLDQAEKGRRK